jgi:O-antigen/teichoic acid export membrane protein
MTLASGSFSLRARVARSIFWIAWSRGVLQVLGFATTLVVARILVPADYGVIALAAIWTDSMGMLAEIGMGAAIIQFRDLDRWEIDTCFWITMTLATSAFVVLALAASPIARWFDAPRLSDVLPLVALSLPVTACRVVPDSLLRKQFALDRSVSGGGHRNGRAAREFALAARSESPLVGLALLSVSGAVTYA